MDTVGISAVLVKSATKIQYKKQSIIALSCCIQEIVQNLPLTVKLSKNY